MAIKYKIPVSGKAHSAAQTAVKAGKHGFIIDEPVERHGTDEGATPLEYLVGAYIGCTNVISSRIAAEMGIALHNDAIEAEAELDGTVLTGEDCPLAFPRLKLTVTGRTDATAEQIATLRQELAKRCPVAVLFRQSGTDIVEDWKLEPL